MHLLLGCKPAMSSCVHALCPPCMSSFHPPPRPSQPPLKPSPANPTHSFQGVGPATASAVLSAADPSVPFMSDEALEAALGSRDYTVPQYLRLLEELRSKAEELSGKGEGVFVLALEACGLLLLGLSV